MFNSKKLKSKLISSAILVAMCVVMFLLLLSKPDNSMFGGFHLGLLIVYLPLFSAAYGIALPFVSFSDGGFLLCDAVMFLGFAIAGTFTGTVYEFPAALVYTGIMLAFMGITAAVRHFIRDWREHNSKRKARK